MDEFDDTKEDFVCGIGDRCNIYPEGDKCTGEYAYSADIQFEIKADGTISITNSAANASVSGQTLVMRDAPIAISVEKVDETTSAHLSNAILAVIDAESGKELERFTTNGTVHALDMSKITVPLQKIQREIIFCARFPHRQDMKSQKILFLR